MNPLMYFAVLTVDIVLEGEFEATKEITLGIEHTNEDDMVSDFIKSPTKKPINRFQKEQFKNISQNSSERSIENSKHSLSHVTFP
jgi:hypothetical protein